MNSIKDINKKYIVDTRSQHTLAKSVSFSGVGIHKGDDVNMTLLPATAGTGIVFKRIDLEGSPSIPAHISKVHGFSRSTNIGTDDAKVITCEHILAALHACNIDNAIIELDAQEPPIGDGGALIFLELIEKAGIRPQTETIPICRLDKPLFFSKEDVTMVALPCDSLKISYTLHYPNCKAIRSQYYSFDLSPDTFKREIAPCRTFCLYEEVALLIDQGLIKGGSLDSAVVIKGDSIVNPEGLKFEDEVARHKVLDIVGDTKLVSFPIRAHIIGIRSGHASNGALIKKLFEHFTSGE